MSAVLLLAGLAAGALGLVAAARGYRPNAAFADQMVKLDQLIQRDPDIRAAVEHPALGRVMHEYLLDEWWRENEETVRQVGKRVRAGDPFELDARTEAHLLGHRRSLWEVVNLIAKDGWGGFRIVPTDAYSHDIGWSYYVHNVPRQQRRRCVIVTSEHAAKHSLEGIAHLWILNWRVVRMPPSMRRPPRRGSKP